MTTFAHINTPSDHAASTPLPIGYTQDDELLTFHEAMTRLKVSRSTLYRLMWSGQLTGHKLGFQWRFYASDLKRTLQPQTFSQCI